MTQPLSEQARRASIAGLHEQLGEVVARLPAECFPPNRPQFGCSFRSIPPVPYVDLSACDRLQDYAADARREMGEERWAELQAEWSHPPEIAIATVRKAGERK